MSFLIKPTLIANLHVDKLSGISSYFGLTVAIILVLQFPPKESLRTIVIKDYL